MGLPSGNFHSPYAGTLAVSFTAEFTTSSGGDWGSGSGRYIVLRGTVYDGATLKGTLFIKTGDATGLHYFDYPGGDVNWTVALTEETYALSGPSSVSALNPRITCILLKR